MSPGFLTCLTLTFLQTAYLTASLLIDPQSELNILLTATIQADLKSDNFLTVCTALQAIPTIANVELANVFLPEVVGLVKHDRDQVKKRALVTLHSLLRVDPAIGPEISKVFVEKLGYKEPAVMFAVLPGLYELISHDPKPYKGLVHYFTNILKQAAEGKLGRSWVTHKAPAPFLQITLLRLLALLGKDDPQVSSDMKVIIMDVWKRAQALMNQAGNAILFECMKTATTIVPSDALYSLSLDTAAIFLNSTDNNLKCAGIEILSRLIEDGDAGKVQQHQMSIVTALRSPDVTLKGRTLDLLFRMSGPHNIDVVFNEVIMYITDDSIDEESRRSASTHLLEAAEKFAPSLTWFVDSMTELLKKAGVLAPISVQHSLMQVIKEGSGGNDAPGDIMLQHRTTQSYYQLLTTSKVSIPLAKVICWTLGEYGYQAGISFDSVCMALADTLESRGSASDLAIVCISALSKISLRNAKPLPPEVMSILRSLKFSKKLQVQQAAHEACTIAEKQSELQGAALYQSSGNVDLGFLDGIAQEALNSGAAPYIQRSDREAIGIGFDEPSIPTSSPARDLRYEAYETQTAKVTESLPPVDFFNGLDIHQQDSQPARQSVMDDSSTNILHVNKSPSNRKWGPHATTQPPGAGIDTTSRAEQSVATSATQSKSAPASPSPVQVVDPLQESLAASLFGLSKPTNRDTANIGVRVVQKPKEQPAAFDLLDLAPEPASTETQQTTKAPQSLDILDLLDEPAVQQVAQNADIDPFDTMLGQDASPAGDIFDLQMDQSAGTGSAPSQTTKGTASVPTPIDPFQDLL
jgi:AP-4 complex subunit epsilon-1